MNVEEINNFLEYLKNITRNPSEDISKNTCVDEINLELVCDALYLIKLAYKYNIYKENTMYLQNKESLNFDKNDIECILKIVEYFNKNKNKDLSDILKKSDNINKYIKLIYSILCNIDSIFSDIVNNFILLLYRQIYFNINYNENFLDQYSEFIKFVDEFLKKHYKNVIIKYYYSDCPFNFNLNDFMMLLSICFICLNKDLKNKKFFVYLVGRLAFETSRYSNFYIKDCINNIFFELGMNKKEFNKFDEKEIIEKIFFYLNLQIFKKYIEPGIIASIYINDVIRNIIDISKLDLNKLNKEYVLNFTRTYLDHLDNNSSISVVRKLLNLLEDQELKKECLEIFVGIKAPEENKEKILV